MSGHSKWSTIKRKKAATDAKRGAMFTKYLKEVQMAAKLGGGVEGNFRLKTAVVAAKAVSVPNDSIEKAIRRGTGQDDGADYEEIVYEGYGPGGVALLIKAMTDNRNRTASEVRSTLSKYGGSLGSVNSVAYLFQEKGIINVPKNMAKEDDVFSAAIEAGAGDVVDSDENWEVSCEVSELENIKQSLQKLVKDIEGEIQMVPSTQVHISGDAAKSLLKLIDMLEELDDVQNVTANFEMDETLMESF